MSTIEEIFEGVQVLNETLQSVDTKLDAVAAYIATLKADTLVTQDQLNTLGELVGVAKTEASKVLDEAAALTMPTPAPTEAEAPVNPEAPAE